MVAFDFGARLKDLRESRKLTQLEVADKLNIENSTISGYERNVTTPSLDVLKKLALFYNVSADYLLGITDREIIHLDDFTEAGKRSVVRLINELKIILNEET